MHLVKDYWSRITLLYPKKGNETTIGFDWIKLLYEKAFQHPTLSIMRMAVMTLLDTDFNTTNALLWDIDFICDSLVNYVSVPILYKLTRDDYIG